MAAITRVMENQHFILGPEVEALEAEVAGVVECRHAIGCASGSDALLLALMALGVGARDEVITPPFSFVATAGSIARLGARPVFVDIDPDTYNLDPRRLEKAITPRTKAILPVHLFGLAAEMDPILEIAGRHELPVIEDAAQSIGARYHGKAVGSLGRFGCFSFFPSKNLGGAGDGGMVTTQDPQLAERVRMLRQHGSRTKYAYEMLGMNSRLDALQAAILRVKLRHLSQLTAARQRHAQHYAELFHQAGLDQTIGLPPTCREWVHVWNQFVIRTPRRDPLRQALRHAGIPTEIYYPSPLHRQPAFADLEYQAGAFPQAEAACQEVLALPVFPAMSDEQQQQVVGAIADFFRG